MILCYVGLQLTCSNQLVDKSSATLDIARDPLCLDQPHVLMNKFESGDCDDFKRVLKKIRDLVGAIRLGSPLSQADAWIVEKVYNDDRLKIERLSGDSLSMEQCYINLAIVEKSSQDTGLSDSEGTKSSQFSILSRQKVETPDESLQVELPMLFNSYTKRDGTRITPRRILIRGRAGIGKTTLCKKIVYEFYHGTWSEWKNHFDRVLWIPLRKLKRPGGLGHGYNLERLCEDEYFSYPVKRRDLTNALVETLLTKRTKCLLLLDGLDEISHILGVHDHDMKTLLDDLLNFPNVIVTSRPHVEHDSFRTMDLQLETIGFYPAQVDTYIEKSFSGLTDDCSKDKVRDIKNFLQRRWLLQSLVRIPIQLDAVCFTWQYWNPEGIPSTMTGIYNEIEKNLWAKDAVRMGKKHGRELVTHQVAVAEYENLFADEIYLLEGLGFTGLWNDVIEFTAEHRQYIYTEFKRGAFLPAQTLPKLSFLRTSDHAKDINGSYHFIHLTFQEYFAAKYFVRQWKRDEELYLLALDSDDGPKKILPAQFLREHKYSTRYNIFWRLVAGLLGFRDIGMTGQTPAERVTAFFKVLEQEPIDLLGPAHQRLIIHCLSEITTTFPGQMAFQKRLAQWLLFESKSALADKRTPLLVREIEFPDEALKIALLDKTSGTQAQILESLVHRNLAAPGLVPLLKCFLVDWREKVRFSAIRVLKKDDNLPHEVLDALVTRLEDKYEFIQEQAAEALAAQATLPRKTVGAILSRLDHESTHVRLSAFKALCNHESFDDIITAVLERITKSRNVHGDGVEVLGKQVALPEKWLAALRELLSFAARGYVSKFYPTRATLPDTVLLALVEQLDNDDGFIQSGAVVTLVNQAELPDTIKTAIEAQLQSKNCKARAAAIQILSKRDVLSKATVDAIAAQLGDKSSEVRVAAVKALGKHATMTDMEVQAIATLLGDNDSKVRCAAVDALGRQAALPDEVLNAMVALLDAELLDAELLDAEGSFRTDPNIQDGIKKILTAQAAMPRNVLEAAVANLDNEQDDVRHAGVYTLRRQEMLPIKSLPGEILKAMVPHLVKNDWRVQHAAFHLLYGLEAMSDEVLTNVVVASLDTRNGLVDCAAKRILQREFALPDRKWPKKAVKAVLAQLQNSDKNFQYRAIRILEGQLKLPTQVLEALMARLIDESHISRKAADVLESQTVLPPEILAATTAWRDKRLRSIMQTLTKMGKNGLYGLYGLYGELMSRKTLPDVVLSELANIARQNKYNLVARRLLMKHAELTSRMLPTEALLNLVGVMRMESGYSAMKVLGAQPTLPDRVLTELVALLEDDTRGVRSSAEEILRRHRKFYYT